MEELFKIKPQLRFQKNETNLNSFHLYEIVDFLKGKNISKNDIEASGKHSCIRYGELYTVYNELIDNVISKTNLPKSSLVFSKSKDIIIPSSGESNLDIATASCILKEGIALGGDLNILRPKTNSDFSSIYLSYYLNNKKKKRIAALAQGNSVVHLYKHHLSSLSLILPSLHEQQKIASFLSTVDKKINLLESKIEHLEQYKKGVVQKIFNQEIRFKPVPNANSGNENGKSFPEWEKKKLGSFLIHKSQRNNKLEIQLVLSVSNKKGFILQSDQFDKHRVASKDVSNYKIVNKNDIAYNPSRINVGSIATLRNYEKGIVSPMYVVFSLKRNMHLAFFEYLIETHLFKHLVKVGCSGSVRDSLNFEDLENFKLKLPSVKEQTKIANFLSSLDKKIDLHKTQLEKMKTWKKGLLQKMFV